MIAVWRDKRLPATVLIVSRMVLHTEHAKACFRLSVTRNPQYIDFFSILQSTSRPVVFARLGFNLPVSLVTSTNDFKPGREAHDKLAM